MAIHLKGAYFKSLSLLYLIDNNTSMGVHSLVVELDLKMSGFVEAKLQMSSPVQ